VAVKLSGEYSKRTSPPLPASASSRMRVAPCTAISRMPARSSRKTTRRCVVEVEFVEVHDRARDALEALERAVDQMVARLCQDDDRDIVGNQCSSTSTRMKSKSAFEAEGKPTSISLKPTAAEQLEHAPLALDVHRVDERLVAVAQVHGDPARRGR